MDPSLIKPAIDLVTAFVRRRSSRQADAEPQISVAVSRHLREALRWSQRIQFYGMSTADDIDSITIPLRLSAEPRKFRSRASQEQRTEIDLLQDDRNYVLLGAPGAGKTTTLKRVTQAILLKPPTGEGDLYQLPIVLRMRELEPRMTLFEVIAEAMGIPVWRREEKVQEEDELVAQRRVTSWVGQSRLDQAVLDFLNESRAVIILDGMDEVPTALQASVRRDIAKLALNTSGSKILASSRSGEYGAVIEGFDVMEICPLDPSEIKAIAGLWLGDPGAFLSALEALPYGDVANRPLLLTQLLFLYKRYGYLPEQPSSIYRKFILLLLQEWDAERGVIRQSRYARFDPERKAAFLGAIAYYLTYRIKTKLFTERHLLDAYAQVYDRFGLPPAEAKQVVSEIETHTGIIAAAGGDAYEFEHLSLQEYLCADYLIREPHAEHLVDYLVAYPAPVAVLIALSSNPSSSFAALFLRSKNPALGGVPGFLARVLAERPIFGTSAALGVAIMKLYHDVGESSYETSNLLDRLIEHPAVGASVAVALRHYHVRRNGPRLVKDFVQLGRVKVLDDPRGFRTPELVSLPVATLRAISHGGNVTAEALLSELSTGA